MSKTKTTRIGKATLVDYGQAEYLDGAAMQFAVWDGAYIDGKIVGYFSTKKYAQIVAEAIGNKTPARNGRVGDQP